MIRFESTSPMVCRAATTCGQKCDDTLSFFNRERAANAHSLLDLWRCSTPVHALAAQSLAGWPVNPRLLPQPHPGGHVWRDQFGAVGDEVQGQRLAVHLLGQSKTER